MTPEEVLLFIGCLFSLFGVLAIAIGVVAAILIGEGEVRFTDTAGFFRDTKVPLGADVERE